VAHGGSRGRGSIQDKSLSPARGDISPSAYPPAACVLQMPPLTGLETFQGAYFNPTACAVGQRTSPLPRLETGGVAQVTAYALRPPGRLPRLSSAGAGF
jgi:hypothetical protein